MDDFLCWVIAVLISAGSIGVFDDEINWTVLSLPFFSLGISSSASEISGGCCGVNSRLE